jgi:hypothetical protein
MGADETNDSVRIGEDADDLGAALDFSVEAFDRIGRVYLRPVVPSTALAVIPIARRDEVC